MRFSWARLLKHKFFKERNFVFEDDKFIGQFFRGYYVVGLVSIVGIMAFIHEFAIPTPDIQYDVKRIVSPNFDQFVRSKGYSSFDLSHRHYIQNFKYTSDGIKRYENEQPIGHFDKRVE